ncbi:MAG: SagB/ThcOx family dehydrogenase [Nitrospiraceae bacterium]|nr:SagB/ThcOx family dehydrogenase [Nitrospiraceae bacterium]
MDPHTPPPTGTATDSSPADPVSRVIHYHNQTKHHFFRYARSLGHLDWANQPNPFRRFVDAPFHPLPLLQPKQEPLSPAYEAIYQRGMILPQPVTVRTLSRFLELALAITAWKRAGQTQWALRSNPSSGNLHPTEGYLVLPPMQGLADSPALYHYAPHDHGLELRAEIPAQDATRLLQVFPREAFLFACTSIIWRESWKYGERAFRYCHHDVGHAIGAARIAAATLGWNLTLLDGTDQATLASLLGMNREEDFAEAEHEHPDFVAVVWPSGDTVTVSLWLDPALVHALSQGRWHGRANRLSHDAPVPWEIIDDVAEATRKTSIEHRSVTFPSHEPSPAPPETLKASPEAGTIIRQRRSAVSLDGKTSITAATFFRMLARVTPGADRPQQERPMPWDALPWAPAIHLLLFVHRVEGLTPGVYVLVRDPAKLPLLKNAMNPHIEWVLAPGCPENLPLYGILEGDAQKVAAQVSCHQDIAGDSAFSLGMLAEFDERLRQGAWWYPRLFWESGLVGQVLYLEAEAAGVRATGIGCFFDDPVHEIIALKDLTFQSLYHFTIGGPVEDPRLTTLPPYAHLKRST